MGKNVTLIVGIAALLSVRVIHAQLAEPYSLPRPANCCRSEEHTSELQSR